MTRGLFSGSSVCVLLLAMIIVGCQPAGPATVPAKGTLTIDGQPANDIIITLVPTATGGQEATGKVANGAFELFTGSEGAAGAMPGKYKVVLASMGGSSESMTASYEKAGSGDSSAAPTVKASFPDKYLGAGTSDKEVEITSGSNDLKIDITGGGGGGGEAAAPPAN